MGSGSTSATIIAAFGAATTTALQVVFSTRASAMGSVVTTKQEAECVLTSSAAQRGLKVSLGQGAETGTGSPATPKAETGSETETNLGVCILVLVWFCLRFSHAVWSWNKRRSFL